MGPAFYFLLREQGVAFNTDAASAALMSLTATLAFLVGYIAVAARTRAAILVAVLAWFACVGTLSRLPPSPWLGLLLFLITMTVARRFTHRFVRPVGQVRARGTLALLILRGVMAGLLVAGVSLASDRLGQVWSGYLISFPIGMTVISVTLHHRLGPDIVIHTLRAAMLGISSLAAFSFALAVLLHPIGATFAFSLALLASVAVTIGLILVSRPGRGRDQPSARQPMSRRKKPPGQATPPARP